MKKIFAVLMSIALVAISMSACSSTEKIDFENIDYSNTITDTGSVDIITFNVAAPWGNAFKGTSSSKRVERFAKIVKFTQPDSVGTQEMNSKWVEKLAEILPEYACYGVERGGDSSKKKSEMNAIFYLKDKYDLIDSGTFWLSETPEKESRYEGAGCNRICSWVVLENKISKKQYIHLNTHLDNASEDAQNYGANVIVEQLKEIQKKYNYIPVFITGDFNQDESGNAVKTILDAGFSNSADFDNAKAVGTYHDWGKITDEERAKQKAIDFVFVSKKSTNGVTAYRVVDSMIDDKYISDHFGVWASFSLK